PSVGAELMLRHKGIEYKRHDLPNMTHRYLLPVLGYKGTTVPALKLDGRKVSGSRAISRALEDARPQPAKLPVDRPSEAWSAAVVEGCVRVLGRWAATKDRSSMASFLEGAKLGVPTSVARASLPVLGPITAMQLKTDDAAARAELAALPGHLDRVDALLA